MVKLPQRHFKVHHLKFVLQLQNCTHILDPCCWKRKKISFATETENANRWFFIAVLDNRLPIIGYHYGLFTCFLFRLVESATVYICFAVSCLVCLPTSCCVIGVNAHLLKHIRSLTDNILVLPPLFPCSCSVSVPRIPSAFKHSSGASSLLSYVNLCSAAGRSQRCT